MTCCKQFINSKDTENYNTLISNSNSITDKKVGSFYYVMQVKQVLQCNVYILAPPGGNKLSVDLVHTLLY